MLSVVRWKVVRALSSYGAALAAVLLASCGELKNPADRGPDADDASDGGGTAEAGGGGGTAGAGGADTGGANDGGPSDARDASGPRIGVDRDAGTVIQLAVGFSHTCALLDGGRVRCWGDGSHGELGYGNLNDVGDDETPASVGDVNVGGVVTQIAVGDAHTCALLEGGSVRCWGAGGTGRLGYGNVESIGDNESPASAGDVDVGAPVIGIAAGGEHTCALLKTGQVRCWGNGKYGALGYANTRNIGDDEPPSRAGDVNVGNDLLSSVSHIAAGGGVSCAILGSTGSVRCWGDNSQGVLGYGHSGDAIGDDETPAKAGDIDIGSSAGGISTGGDHTCALLSAGEIRCWGGNDHGELGYANTIEVGRNNVPASVSIVNLGGRAVSVSASRFHTCTLLETFDVRCWGAGSDGQLGYGNTNDIGDDETPAWAGDVDVGGKVSQIGAGGYHTCALMRSGSVRCWGSPLHGVLGYGIAFPPHIGDTEVPAGVGFVPIE